MHFFLQKRDIVDYNYNKTERGSACNMNEELVQFITLSERHLP